MPAVDLLVLIRQLPRDSAVARLEAGDLAYWDATASNLADLLDVIHAQLSYEYANWTTDPEDPAVKRARAERKRAGLRPPPHPLIPPIAARPTSVADRKLTEYREMTRQWNPEQEPTSSLVSLDEWESALGI